MKKYLFLLLSLLCVTGLVQAQHEGPKHRGKEPDPRQKERVESFKIGFITKELALTPEESQRFWPVYNEMQDKEAALRREYRPDKPVREMTGQEASAHFDRKMAMLDEEHLLQRQYLLKLKEVLPIQKVLMLPHAEREFKRKLMQEMRQRRQGKKED